METYPAAYYPEEGVLSGSEDRIDAENSGDVYLMERRSLHEKAAARMGQLALLSSEVVVAGRVQPEVEQLALFSETGELPQESEQAIEREQYSRQLIHDDSSHSGRLMIGLVGRAEKYNALIHGESDVSNGYTEKDLQWAEQALEKHYRLLGRAQSWGREQAGELYDKQLPDEAIRDIIMLGMNEVTYHIQAALAYDMMQQNMAHRGVIAPQPKDLQLLGKDTMPKDGAYYQQKQYRNIVRRSRQLATYIEERIGNLYGVSAEQSRLVAAQVREFIETQVAKQYPEYIVEERRTRVKHKPQLSAVEQAIAERDADHRKHTLPHPPTRFEDSWRDRRDLN